MVHYRRVRKIVVSLGENAARTFEMHGLVFPLTCRKGLFTVHAKDNLDSNRTSRLATENFHGTSMSTFQFPSQGNFSSFFSNAK